MKIITTFVMVILATNLSLAQEVNLESDSEQLQSLKKSNWESRKNIPKFSFTSLVFRNIQLQYERVLNRKFSAGLAYSMIPEGDFPFRETIINSASSEDDISRYIGNASLKYSSFTPEVRFYVGKGYGKGFYLAPFYRHTSYTLDNINFYYDTDEGFEENLATKGDLSSNTFGLQIGSQFNLGSRLILDWFIIGPHYGSGNGDLAGTTAGTLSETEQQSLRNTLNEIDFPLGEFSNEVNSKGAVVKIEGPWAGIRAGLALGYRF
ncbi:DUF3575 domain-containing protein [Christiangramia aquimixticola]|uniref:DUF3575 domain-containing protein n=1 Tax=Christiangramia aquimixticola TaxID=1697558 RepID=UPI003AA98B13